MKTLEDFRLAFRRIARSSTLLDVKQYRADELSRARSLCLILAQSFSLVPSVELQTFQREVLNTILTIQQKGVLNDAEIPS